MSSAHRTRPLVVRRPIRSRCRCLGRVCGAVLLIASAGQGCYHALKAPIVSYPAPPLIQCSAAVKLGPPAPDRGEPPEPRLKSYPIDLPTALRLADSQNPEIAVARERINQALAIQDRLALFWIPSLEVGN